MKKAKQQSFLGSSSFLMQVSPKKFFGGALLEGRRKHTRPLSVKDSLRFVLRSRWASGKDSFLAARNRKVIENIITHFAKKFGVKIYERALNSNHFHLLLRITNRPLYRAFIKAVSGKVASHVMGQQSFKLFCESRQPGISESRQPKRQTSSFDPNAKISKAGDGVQTAKGAQTVEKNMQTLDKNKIKDGKKNQGFWEFRPFSRIVNWGRDFKTCVQYFKQNVLEALGFVPYKPRKDYYSKWLKDVFPDLTPPIGGGRPP